LAESPSHKFGQIIGDVLEVAIYPFLDDFASKNNLYLDIKRPRKARGGAKKVTWVDKFGNKHDLDFVLEKNGTESKIGEPVAFIESAWRRYTKHSRNKAQEIQGAVLPLASTFKNFLPFLGAIIAGVFTSGAIAQLRSQGFTVLYFSYGNIQKAFKILSIDASFDENTPDSEFKKKVNKWNSLSKSQKLSIAKKLIVLQQKDVKNFINQLTKSVNRKISVVRIIPLHGKSFQVKTLDKAISFIQKYNEKNSPKSIAKYEVEIKYTNGDVIRGEFENKNNAVSFLKNY